MRKILIIAWREYRAMVGTRAFLISMAVMPLLMLGVVCIPAMLQGLQVPAVRTIAVIDQTGGLLPLLQLAADRRNQQLSAARDGQSAASHDGLTAMLGLQDQSLYEFRAHPAGDFGDDDRLLLSQQIRAGKLHAFVEIPINASLTWVSEDPGMSDVRRWCEQTIDSVQRQQRLADCVPAGLLPVVTVALSQSTELQSQGLSFLDDTGQIQREPVQSSLSSIAVPIGIAGMMFVAVLLSVQPMLESVLEEKLLRISEVLLGSASATQLMTGKLAGNAAGAMTIFGLYGAGAICVAWLQGFAESVPWALLPWLLFLQLLAVLLFSSVFMAVAACVNQMREAQCLLMPVWLVLMLPLLICMHVIREPNGHLATAASFFPPATPLLMAVRMSTGVMIPVWQSLLSLAIMLAGTAVGIVVASRLYRAGILRQGRTPGFADLLQLVLRGECGG